jgi:hypothetical protein
MSKCLKQILQVQERILEAIDCRDRHTFRGSVYASRMNDTRLPMSMLMIHIRPVAYRSHTSRCVYSVPKPCDYPGIACFRVEVWKKLILVFPRLGGEW